MKKAIGLIFLFLAIPAYGQVYNVRQEFTGGLPSRGSWAVVEGRGFTPDAAASDSLLDPPDSLGGVTVTVSGVRARLRAVAPDRIWLTIPYDVPVIQPARLRANELVVKAASGVIYRYKLFLDDTSPWIIPGPTGGPLGVSFSASGFSLITDSIVIGNDGGDVSIWTTGVVSSFPLEWRNYYVLLFDDAGNMWELPQVEIFPNGVFYGWNNLKFRVPGDVATQIDGKELEIYVQTPSAFSQAGVKCRFVVR